MHRLSSAGWRAFRIATPLVCNSLANYLHDPALDINSFKASVEDILVCTLLGTSYWAH